MASLLALTDVMSTGYHAAVSAGVREGDTVAVVGDGAVGLSGVLAAKMLGAERVILLGSTHEERHRLAREWGADEVTACAAMTPTRLCTTSPTVTVPTRC
jgi:alcohol dehydrogenase